MQRDPPYGGGPVRLVSTDWLAGELRDRKRLIIDCQPNVHDNIVEHIPGAVNLPWQDLTDAGNKALLRPAEEISAILKTRGIDGSKTVICSCGTGREATNEFLLLRFYLGYPKVKLHEGAFTEWVSYPENPTVTGKSPR